MSIETSDKIMLLVMSQTSISSSESPKTSKRVRPLVSLPPIASGNGATPASRLIPTLPLEICTYILESADLVTLASAARANSTFQIVAESVLYRNAAFCGVYNAISCSRSLLLAGREHRLTALRRFRAFAVYHPFRHPDLVPSIKSVLDAAPSLIDLELELWGSVPILLDKPIRLQRLFAVHDFDHHMLDFLAKVPLLKTLSIVESPRFSVLDSSIVPALESIEGTRAVVELFVPHRPVRKVKVLGDSNQEMVDTLLDALAKSTVHLEYLSLSVSYKSADLLATVAQRFPFLRTIEVQSVEPSYWTPMAPSYTPRFEDELIGVLSLFKCLERIKLANVDIKWDDHLERQEFCDRFHSTLHIIEAGDVIWTRTGEYGSCWVSRKSLGPA
ncbi:hypothetical protein BOTBODRAFT_63488 [Botryobasidium botryosum FD-172 SS1]|uniref:F-box domain-containing protein n=1 Tax=Botryobasidium botryosum (strain FD-172 SS1) TaxID=930990 RepID=A0A067MSI2_BOTB1|nr:hypothetical protein BOTBODRAFT_63488 [Botryobasidium botryosum FD-172 SS1]